MRFEEIFLQYSNQIVGIENPAYFKGKLKKYVYADWAASGRIFKKIEDEIIHLYAPYYSNIHTKDNFIGNFTNNAYEDSKKIIKEHFGASKEYYLFLNGTGMTSSIDKLQRILFDDINIDDTIVFVSGMEHNSNYLSWLELGVEVVVVNYDTSGSPDLNHLKKLLNKNKNKKNKIASFVACSNLTGIKVEWEKIVQIMHEEGGLCFIDFSISAPYIKINLESTSSVNRPDAIFCSMHKFLGGPGAPGILLLKKELYKRKVPTIAGGGTVLWTNPWGERVYYDDIEQREDAGTPGIFQVIRAGLTIKLKESMQFDKIQLREHDIANYLLKELSKIKDVIIYGSLTKDRLPIVALNIRGIKYSVVVHLLSEQYGIQVRGGCMCAGIYSHYLLGINRDQSKYISSNLNETNLKPGFVRISLSAFNSNEEVNYIIESIRDIAQNSYMHIKNQSNKRFDREEVIQ